MQVIKHSLDDILVISLVFETQDDIESVRAYFGNSLIKDIIATSKTPSANHEPAHLMVYDVNEILNPLSRLLKP
jgi:hypothetical protein